MFDVTINTASLLIISFAYFLIVRKDKSWINWMTPSFFLSLGGRYILPLIYVFLTDNPSGSRYAYLFCYTTYAFSMLSAALCYAYIKPIKLRSPSGQTQSLGLLSWLLLLVGIVLYLPILIKFREFLTEPRRIYELTRSGYGPLFFGSTFFATLGFVAYLFQKRKRLLGSLAFYALCGALTFLHGSKGQILNYFLIWMLYQVYVNHKNISALAAISVVGFVAVLTIGSYVLFSSTADIIALMNNLTGYADSVRNAMQVIDDSQADHYLGRLTLENEVYSRIPRVLMPSKPKDYGAFALGKKYDPVQYRSDEGSPNYDIGLTYADFGPFTLIYLCATSALMAWLVSSFTAHLRQRPTAGRFIVFIFLAGVNVIPISGVFLLPETMVIAGAFSFALKLRVVRGGLSLRHSLSTAISPDVS